VALTNTSDFCSVRHCRALLPEALWATTPSCVSNSRNRALELCCANANATPLDPALGCSRVQVTSTHTLKTDMLLAQEAAPCKDESCKEGQLELLMANSGTVPALLPQFLC